MKQSDVLSPVVGFSSMRTFSKHLVQGLLVSASLLTLAYAAAPSQTPLTSRIGDTPQPNVMITIDDSGSMLFDFMPEGSFTVNGKSVRLDPSGAKAWNSIQNGRYTQYNVGYFALFPDDPRRTNAAKTAYPPTYQHGTITAVKNADFTKDPVLQMQWRSPDVNNVFYNPDTLYQPWLKPDGTGRKAASSITAAPWDGFSTALVPASFNLSAKQTVTTNWCMANNTCDSTQAQPDGTSRDFYPGLVYRLKAGADPTNVNNYVRYDVNATDGSHAPATKAATRTDCAASKCSRAEEQQNFANWFTYFRMRESMAKAAISESFTSFKDKIRAGYGRINKTSATVVDGGGSATFKVVEKGVKPLDATYLNTLLTGIQGIQSNNSTPLRTALDSVGAYFDNRTDAYSPWMVTPGATSAPGNVKLSCRRSINVLTTDGYYNDSYTAAGDLDNTDSSYDYATTAQNPNGYSPTKFKAVRPFIDNPNAKVSDTLADAALKWYMRDLDTSIDNKVTPVDGDIAFWQHLTQFTVGIGVKGTLDASSATAKATTLTNLSSGATNWPNPTAGNAQKIDDMWHAAVNTGGDFYSVRNVTELTNALSNAFGRAGGSEARESGVATVAVTLTTSNLKFVPQYKSGAWYGDVLAFDLDNSGNVTNSKPRWRAAAADILNQPAQRNLFTWTGSAPVAFTGAALAGATSTRDLISTDAATANAIIDYIRGDATNEGVTGLYRSRSGNKLGDFVNSPPVFVKDQVDLGYGALTDSSQKASYSTYLADKKARADGVVFVGSNDGMLHGFRGSTGVEVFGYLPRAGLSGLPSLAAKDYGSVTNFHKFFVDGPVMETDAYIVPRGEAAARWTNMLVGTMGAGGRSVFALNLPTADPTTAGATSVQWELADDSDLGYVLGDVRVGKIQGGSGWYAFVGNGPYSTSGNGVLLVVNLQTGVVEKRITVPGLSGNGLGGVRLLYNTNREVYAAYAGDLQGNLWRFDFGSGADNSSWKVGFKNKPLYRAADGTGARVAQPIVAAPIVTKHPNGGYLVLFGTGRLIDLTDASNMAPQSFYGVWDSTPVEASAADVVSPFHIHESNESNTPFRDDLVQQTINTTPVKGTKTDASGNVVETSDLYYKMSSNPVDWSAKKGWYVDLSISGGQRVIYPAQTVLDYVYFSSIVPAAQAAACDFTVGAGYNFLVNALTGSAVATQVFDTNNDGVVDTKDAAVSGFKTQADGVDKLLSNQENVVDKEETDGVCLPDPNKRCPINQCLVAVVNTSNEAETMCIPGKPKLCAKGFPVGDPRCNPQIVDRVWRQIINPPQP